MCAVYTLQLIADKRLGADKKSADATATATADTKVWCNFSGTEFPNIFQNTSYEFYDFDLIIGISHANR